MVNCNEQTSGVATADLLRELIPQVIGVVLRRFPDFEAAEDAVQEAALAAVLQWPRDGVPENARAWLTQVAFRRMADQIRSESARRGRELKTVEDARLPLHIVRDPEPLQDDTLLLLLMCCH